MESFFKEIRDGLSDLEFEIVNLETGNFSHKRNNILFRVRILQEQLGKYLSAFADPEN